jgi:hypothetical protein
VREPCTNRGRGAGGLICTDVHLANFSGGPESMYAASSEPLLLRNRASQVTTYVSNQFKPLIKLVNWTDTLYVVEMAFRSQVIKGEPGTLLTCEECAILGLPFGSKWASKSDSMVCPLG